jgi:hypothetical protein
MGKCVCSDDGCCLQRFSTATHKYRSSSDDDRLDVVMLPCRQLQKVSLNDPCAISAKMTFMHVRLWSEGGKKENDDDVAGGTTHIKTKKMPLFLNL